MKEVFSNLFHPRSKTGKYSGKLKWPPEVVRLRSERSCRLYNHWRMWNLFIYGAWGINLLMSELFENKTVCKKIIEYFLFMLITLHIYLFFYLDFRERTVFDWREKCSLILWVESYRFLGISLAQNMSPHFKLEFLPRAPQIDFLLTFLSHGFGLPWVFLKEPITPEDFLLQVMRIWRNH